MDTFPLAPGVMVFGMVYGLTSRKVGLSVTQTWLMSLTVFAGAAQFSALQVWNSGSAGMIILVTLVVNLRYLLLSSSIAPYLVGQHWLRKAFGAFMLSDESYALAVSRYATGAGSYGYLIGVNLGLYIEWAMASLIGAVLEDNLIDLASYRLDLIFPLAFLGMLVPIIRNRMTLAVVLISGGLALVGSLILPGKWYILIAGLGASTVGVVLEDLWKHH